MTRRPLALVAAITLTGGLCAVPPRTPRPALRLVLTQPARSLHLVPSIPTAQPSRASRSRAILAADPIEQWANSPRARHIALCESSNNPRARNGQYRGLWQIGPNEWADWGGLDYAERPDLATTAEQNIVAHTGWEARGWEPWDCYRLTERTAP